MHSVIIAATSATIAALSVAGFGSSVETSLVLVAFGVALIGVPHGALDPIAGQRLFSQIGSAWWVPFFRWIHCTLGNSHLRLVHRSSLHLLDIFCILSMALWFGRGLCETDELSRV